MSASISWLDKVYKRYKETGRVIPEMQEKFYSSIERTFASGKTVVDVGMGIGIGSNILARSARFVWGLDINEESIDFGKKVFKRSNLDFEYYDIENPPTRAIAQFEIVVVSEIIEHLENPEVAINNLKRFFSDKASTIGFITVPNINNPSVKERDAKNPLHLHRWTPEEFETLMKKHFKEVSLYSIGRLDQWNPSEMCDISSTDDLICVKIEGVI